jgi:hypothetical protein
MGDCPWEELMVRCWADEPDDRPEFTVILDELNAMARDARRDGEGAAYSFTPP